MKDLKGEESGGLRRMRRGVQRLAVQALDAGTAAGLR